MTGVLIVEDDSGIRTTFHRVLGHYGFHARLAANGKEALAMLDQEEAPCVILLDLMMPVMDGWEFLRERALRPDLLDIPVVILSAVADRTQAPAVDAVLAKPVHFQDLVEAVQRFCVCETPAG